MVKSDPAGAARCLHAAALVVLAGCLTGCSYLQTGHFDTRINDLEDHLAPPARLALPTPGELRFETVLTTSNAWQAGDFIRTADDGTAVRSTTECASILAASDRTAIPRALPGRDDAAVRFQGLLAQFTGRQSATTEEGAEAAASQGENDAETFDWFQEGFSREAFTSTVRVGLPTFALGITAGRDAASFQTWAHGEVRDVSVALDAKSVQIATCCYTYGCGDYVVASVRELRRFLFRTSVIQVRGSGSYTVYEASADISVESGRVEFGTLYELVLRRVPSNDQPITEICPIESVRSVRVGRPTRMSLGCPIANLQITATNGEVTGQTFDAQNGTWTWSFTPFGGAGDVARITYTAAGRSPASTDVVIARVEVEPTFDRGPEEFFPPATAAFGLDGEEVP